MSDQPLVTVYMPTKNRLELLKRAIFSVQAQTYPNWELIIVNDASTDDTKSYLDDFEKKHENIRVIHNDRSVGACASRNKAIYAANGYFVTGIDDDDEFLPARLEKMVNAYSDEFAYVSTGLFWVTEKKAKPILARDMVMTPKTELYINNAGNQVLTTKEKFLSVGGFDKEFVSLQDYECFYRLVCRYGKAKRIGQPLMNIHVAHGKTRISTNPKSVRGFYQFIEKHRKALTPSVLYSMKSRILDRQGRKLSLCYLYCVTMSRLLKSFNQ